MEAEWLMMVNNKEIGLSRNDESSNFQYKIKDLLANQNLYFTCNGKLVNPESISEEKIEDECCIRCHLRILGGKGGFGSMLRALGAQIEKTTNREACRDLSGRRMRDVNNEKAINDWLEKQKTDEEEKAKKKKEKLERILNPPRHVLSDSSYVTELKANAEKVDDALKQGLGAKQKAEGSIHSKRQQSREIIGKAKKQRMWLGLDDSDMEDEDDEERDNDSDTECKASPIDDTKASPTLKENEKEKVATKKQSTVEETPVAEMKKSKGEGQEPAKVLTENPALNQNDKSVTNEKESTQNQKQISEKDQYNLKEDAEKNVSPVDLQSYNTAEELEVLGLERLKCELMKYGLKCGGTLPQRAQRLYMLKDTPVEKLDKSLFAKPSKRSLK